MLRQVTFAPTLTGWQKAARRALQSEWPPAELFWQELDDAQPSLDLAEELEDAPAKKSKVIKVPREFMEIATRVVCHREARKWPLLYRVLWRLLHGERHLLKIAVDPDVHELHGMEKAIRHDVHKMRAFVRFRVVEHEGASWHVAWFEPEHHIVELNAPFFVDRFANMCWSILTPDRCVHWDGKQVSFTDGVLASEAPGSDATESLWLKYYAHIFNPARVKIEAMQSEMPKKYWKNLPEAAVIPALLREAPARVNEMVRKSRAKPQPEEGTFEALRTITAANLPELGRAAAVCTACPLYRNATQTVFGEGLPMARLVFVGEQPGDQEDLQGRPFVGPAGQLFDRALAEVGLERPNVYVTNAVKHFKWEPAGKRRLHKTPSPREIAACRPWLEAELGLIKPGILVCLGGTAARSVLGATVRVVRDRGQLMPSAFCPQTLVTFHPSALLRNPDPGERERQYQEFLGDLRLARQAEAGMGS